MKTRIIFSCFVLLLLFNTASAQIAFTIEKHNVACNNSSPGSIKITVNPTHPPYTYLWNNGETTHILNDLPVGTYSVVITDSNGADTTVSVSVAETKCEMGPELVFTPNGDGINDTWFISNAEFFSNAEVLIYNRLGQKVYEHKGYYEPWDGRDLFNVPLPDAAYFYIIYSDKSDDSTLKKGSVSIVK